jgi:hypothetical protein
VQLAIFAEVEIDAGEPPSAQGDLVALAEQCARFRGLLGQPLEVVLGFSGKR